MENSETKNVKDIDTTTLHQLHTNLVMKKETLEAELQPIYGQINIIRNELTRRETEVAKEVAPVPTSEVEKSCEAPNNEPMTCGPKE